MLLSICNINIPPLTPSPFLGVDHLTNPSQGVGNLTQFVHPTKHDFSEQDIASMTEWLTKSRLQKLREAFGLNYKIPFCNFNMKKGQMVLISYWF